MNLEDDAIRLLHAPANDAWEAVPVDGAIFKPGRREDEHLKPIAPPIRHQEGDGEGSGASAPKAAPRIGQQRL